MTDIGGVDKNTIKSNQSSCLAALSPAASSEMNHSPLTTHNSHNRKAAFTLAEGATHVAHWKDSHKVAFTLAEVLITLGIIGVVAALTLPTLISNYQEKQYEAKYAKAKNVMANGIKMMMAQNDVFDVADLPFVSCSDNTCMNTELSKVLKNYQEIKDRSTLPQEYKNDQKSMKIIQENSDFLSKFLTVDESILKAATFKWASEPDFVFRLEGSMVLGIKKGQLTKDVLEIDTKSDSTIRDTDMADEMVEYSVSPQKISSGNKINRADDATVTCLQIYVDVNGSAPPNTVGRDMYEFVLSEKGRITELSTWLNPALGAIVNRLEH